MRTDRSERNHRRVAELDLRTAVVKLWLIKLPYWLGIAADALWAIALLFPSVFGALTGVDGFSPDWQMQSVMAIGGVLMAGWTVLLVWAVQRPVDRRFVILLTAWVVAALFLVALINVLKGNTSEYWILIKCLVLFAAMLTSYSLAGETDKTAVDS
jgi:FtsH-binding integral membrane protein